MGLFNHFLERLTHSETEQAMQQAGERIIEDFDNYNHLMKLQDDRQLLEVCIEDSKNSFQSMVLGIDFIEGSFSLDEFSPALQQPEALVGQDIVIRHQRHWEKLEINAQVERWSEQEHCYYLNLPEFVDYQPRRHYPRLLLANNNPLKTHINPLYGTPWFAIVKDISQGGMRVDISGDLRPHLHRDKVLPKCQILLDDNISIHCRGLVRSFSYYSKPHRHTQISIEFTNMTQAHQRDLKRFIDYVEIAA